jgi:hypothetical protein
LLLQRNLVYTGITRGKRLVVVIGQRKALAMAVRNNRTEQPFSGLLAVLIESHGIGEGEDLATLAYAARLECHRPHETPFLRGRDSGTSQNVPATLDASRAGEWTGGGRGSSAWMSASFTWAGPSGMAASGSSGPAPGDAGGPCRT